MPPRPVVLITGSSGFLGQAMAARLMRHYRVVGLDTVQPRKPLEGVETILVDLTSDDNVRGALGEIRRRFGTRLASVIHLAAYYDLSGEPDPKYQSVTVEGTRRLLRALQRGFDRVEQFAFASTMLVHAPTQPGRPINEDWPLEPKWAYPQSKVEAEQVVRAEHGSIPVVILRPAGVYDERCRSAFLAQQIARIFERQPTSYLFAGDPSRGQPSLHLDDLVDAVERVVNQRGNLPAEAVFLLGETETPSYKTLQRRIGELVHGESWPVVALPKPLVEAGAWVQEEVLAHDPFIRPWMVEIADDHYELDISRARTLLGWSPRRSLLATLPAMIAALKADPTDWYEDNKLNPSVVAAAEPELQEVVERQPPSDHPSVQAVDTVLAQEHGATLWAHLANIALGSWLLVGPFAYGLFDPVGPLPPPPAAGHELPPPELRNAWLAWSEMASGLAVIGLSCLALARARSWAPWAVALVGVWVLFAPLVFWTTSAAAYAVDTLIGTLVIVFAVMVPPQPGISREALASPADVPLGWSYSPSSYVQRVPIVALAFVGLFISRYLGAFQLGHIDGLWDPFFSGHGGGRNGTEAVVTSSVSKSFPIADAGLGAVTYILDILTGIVGDQRRWRTMPWLVLLFGLLIVPLGAVSVGFIIIQPTIIGALCTLCLVQAAITVLLIPYSVDEVFATAQYLWQSRRVGSPVWLTLIVSGPVLSEQRDPVQGLNMPIGRIAWEFLRGGVTYPWTLVGCTLIGVYLLCTRLLHGVEPSLYFSDHVAGCVAIVVAVTAWAEVARSVRLLNVPLGLWVAVSPFLLDGGTAIASVADLVAGLALAVLSLPRGTRSREHYGGWDQYIL
ncbi:vitamin K epoxide reductase [Microvirga vignae]|uniref:Vitamin K epoxide reductase n=1 Tax=Microvirga vignae TaxID=1225564 RepID=A0A0H1R525_9HYPH|nr:NAD-dependent epimerase/dehydratase family protein [Microvirga vignae]KLK90194.1 vitamin K epoxide reductase [Microvirga vignae]